MKIICTKRNCGGHMKIGIAIQNTFVGIPDFIGDDRIVTMSYGGSGKLITCYKCPKCGHSVYRFKEKKKI